MLKDNDNLIPFPPETTKSVLDEVLREGARKMLARAIEVSGQETAFFPSTLASATNSLPPEFPAS